MHPNYLILADGIDITAQIADRLVRLTVTDEAGHKSDAAELTLDNRDAALSLPPTGARLDIAAGLGLSLVSLGQFVVDELSGEIGPDTLTLSAKGADMLGPIRARKTRAWTEKTLGAIGQTIAGDNGLTPQVSASIAGHMFPYLAQTAESDLHFLTRICRDLDAVAKVVSGRLMVVKRGEGKSASGAALPVFAVDRSDMAGASFSITSRGRVGRVTAGWGDRAGGQIRTVTVGDKDPEQRLRRIFADETAARQVAQSTYDRSNRASGEINVDLGGFWPALMAEASVTLTGLMPELCGPWLITSVTHELDGALTTSFKAERDNEEKSNAKT